MKTLKALPLLLALLAFTGYSQDLNSISSSQTGSITAAGTTCGGVNCVWLSSPLNTASVTFQLSGTFSATITFEASTTGSVWSSLATATATGSYSYSLSGQRFVRARCSAYTSGTVVVSISSSTTGGGNLAAPNGVSFQVDNNGIFSSIGGVNSQGSLTAGPKFYIGPAITGFNNFDQATVQGISIFSQLNSADSWAPIIGLNESNNTAIGFNVGAYFQASATNSSGAMQNNIGVFGEGDGFSTGAGTIAALGGVEGLTELHTGAATIQAPFISYARVDAATTATNLMDFYGQGHIIQGTVTNNYGLYLSDVTGGATLNQAIHTGAGWNFHGDVVSIGSTVASRPNNLLYAKGTSTGGISLGWITDATTFGCLTFSTSACAIANYFIGSDGTDLRLNSPSATVILAANNSPVLTAAATLVTSAVPIAVSTVAFASLGTVAAAGVHKYCTNCTTAATCASGGSGHMATSNGTAWTCQ